MIFEIIDKVVNTIATIGCFGIGIVVISLTYDYLRYKLGLLIDELKEVVNGKKAVEGRVSAVEGNNSEASSGNKPIKKRVTKRPLRKKNGS